MKLILKLSLSILAAFAIAFLFDFFLLDLFERPLLDQALLLFASTAALSFVIFSAAGAVSGANASFSAPNIKIDRIAVGDFLRRHLPGLLLASIFFAAYLFIGLKLNQAGIDTTDNYLDADNSTWMSRISDPGGYKIEMRGPHPFAYFIFRPLGWVMNVFTHSPPLSAILLNTFTGALCVFMAWAFIRREFQNSVYAVLIAGLFGMSTAHIFFGSVVESYIFSAAALIGFLLLLQAQSATGALVASGLLTFGITLTNFVQNFIGILVARPRWREIFRFAAWTLSLGILLSLVHAAWYPSSKLFFLPSGVQAEEEFSSWIFSNLSWRTFGRVILLARTILLYTIIAPRPHVFTKSVGGTFPRFNFFEISPGTFAYSNYAGLGNLLVMIWAAVLFAAGLSFLWKLARTRKTDLSLAFALSLLFNFALHLSYGYEPFLYSPDWGYALIFFVAFGLAPLAGNRWFQLGMLVFLGLLAYNQYQFFVLIFQTISPFVS
jgi:hypothetical protein